MPYVPILGAAFCFVQMMSLPADTWARLIIWMEIGMTIFFTYSIKRSKIRIGDAKIPDTLLSRYYAINLIVFSLVSVVLFLIEQDKFLFLMWVYVGIEIMIRIICVVWTFSIAKNIGQNKIAWALFSLVLPAFSLIILSFQDTRTKA